MNAYQYNNENSITDYIVTIFFTWAIITVIFGWGYSSVRFLYFDNLTEFKVNYIHSTLYLENGRIPTYNWTADFCNKEDVSISHIPIGTTFIHKVAPIRVGDKKYFLYDKEKGEYKYVDNGTFSDKIENNFSAIIFGVISLICIAAILYHISTSFFHIINDFIHGIMKNTSLFSITSYTSELFLKVILLFMWIILWIYALHLLITLPKLPSFIMGPVLATFFSISVLPHPYNLAKYATSNLNIKLFINTLQNIGFIYGSIILFLFLYEKFNKIYISGTIADELIDLIKKIIETIFL